MHTLVLMMNALHIQTTQNAAGSGSWRARCFSCFSRGGLCPARAAFDVADVGGLMSVYRSLRARYLGSATLTHRRDKLCIAGAFLDFAVLF